MKNQSRSIVWLRHSVLIALLVAAACLAVGRYMPPPQPAAAPALAPEPDRRVLREAAYDKDIAALQELMQSSATDETTRAQAAAMLQMLIAEHQTELAVEEALEAVGYAPELVLMQNNALTIMLDGEASAEVSALILELCAAHADVAAENVRIMGQ